ncbi:hypothetical protein PAMA_007269 [Pampus argenteus]
MFLLIACCALKSQFTNRSVATYLLFCGTCDKLGDVVIFTQKVNRKEETAESFCLLTERRHRMALLGLTLMFLLLFEDISGQIKDIVLYHRPADDVILSCDTGRSCPTVQWLYNRDLTKTDAVVQSGNVVKNSARAARVSLTADCSLVIKNITAEDAGLYTCQRGLNFDISINLNIITLSLSPPDADLKRDDTIMVDCSLLGFDTNRRRCQQQRIRWVDEAGSELLGEGGGHKVIGQRNCLSSLTVKRHSGLNRKYTCQVLDRNNNKVLIDVDYTPVFTGTMSDDQSNTAADWSYLGFIFLTLRITGLITIIIILLIQGRGAQRCQSSCCCFQTAQR